jgi:hypothetical protein
VVTDSLNPGGVTAPDAIVTCATSEISMFYVSGGAVISTDAPAVPVGCLRLYNGEWVEVAWASYSMKLTQQTDGNLVLTTSDGTTTTTQWSSNTTFKGNSNGPGCLAQFQSNADLVVDNCDGTLIWDTKTHTYPNAVLVFRFGGGFVIYDSLGGTALWTA